MKKAFSLIELVIVVALIAILLSVASLSSRTIIENRALEEAKNKILLVLIGSVERSFNEGEEYEVIVDIGNKNLIVTKNGSSSERSNVELPEILYYYISIDDDSDPDSETVYATVSGGYSKGNGSPVNFSIYIFGENEDVKYRISVVGITASNLAKINIYKNKTSTETLDTIEDYVIKPGEWIKE